MTCTSTSAPTTHAFDPQTWLAEFEQVGGGYVVNHTRFALIYQIEGQPLANQRKACAMTASLSDDDKAALIAFLREREGEA
jgi:hypothetical protein